MLEFLLAIFGLILVILVSVVCGAGLVAYGIYTWIKNDETALLVYYDKFEEKVVAVGEDKFEYKILYK